MFNVDKMVEMMNPVKAFEAMGQGKLFDVEVQSKAIETATDQAVGLMDFYQEQTRKVVEFWMEQNDAAVKEGKKLVKEWAATVTKTSSEFAGKMETTVKDAAEAIEPPKTTKAAKKA